MHRTALGFILLISTTVSLAEADIWQALFQEKLQEATRGNSNAQYDIGTMYQNGRGVKADRSKAINWYRKAASQDNQKAISRLKLIESNEDRLNKELARASNGDMESQYNLGKMFTQGIGVNIDHSQATSWYEKAANQGSVKAEYKLGLIYYEGTGTRKNSKVAFKWFQRAAENGYPPAQYYLGKMYASGQGVARNYTTSLKWYSKAVDGGFNKARGEMIDISEKLKEKSSADATHTANKIKSDNKSDFFMEDLMLASWRRNDKPVTFLPSAINNCRTEDERIVCYSDDQTRKILSSTVKFKTKAIISKFSHNGSFQVSYRNLVIDATQIELNQNGGDDVVVSINEGIENTHKINTGWGKEHHLECTFKNSTTVSCLKNRTHELLLVSPQKLAVGK